MASNIAFARNCARAIKYAKGTQKINKIIVEIKANFKERKKGVKLIFILNFLWIIKICQLKLEILNSLIKI